MRKTKNLFSILVMAIFSVLFMTSCSSVTVDGGQEVVFIEKPLLFGKGGVDPTPLTDGREWIAVTTSTVTFNVTPVTYTEAFNDMMPADNTPIDLNAYFKIRPIPGKTPLLYKNFTQDWYKHSLQAHFRTLVRDEASPYRMFDLTSRRDTSARIQAVVLAKARAYIDSLDIPVDLQEVIIGAATPPSEVLEENKRTAAQNQNKLTQDARAAAELARKQAEINKAVADKAYKTEMNMTTSEYLQLRSLEIEKEKIEIVRDKQNVTVVMGQGLQPTIPIK